MSKLQNVSHKELVLHAVLLLRSVNQLDSKENHLAMYDKLSDPELIDYIEHFHDPQPSFDYESYMDGPDPEEFGRYTSCTAGDYGPSNPWDAPGMSIRDFI